MVLGTLAIASLVDLATGGVFGYVGARVAGRHVAGPARRAALAFGVWWYFLSFNAIQTGLRGMAAAFDLVPPDGVVESSLVALSYAAVIALCAGVAGLLYFLVYLFRGSERAFWPIVGFYAAYAVVAVYAYSLLQPNGVAAGKWFAGVTTGSTIGSAFFAIMVLLLFVPQIGGAVAYGALYFRLESAEKRYRVALVSTSLAVWLTLTLLAPFLGLGRYEWWAAGGRLVGLAAALAVLLAYHPTRAIRARLARAEAPREGVAK